MIRITKQADYAVVLMTTFAAARRAGVRSARELARDTGIPLPTVSKILKGLARAGLLDSRRGVKGGYGLARDAAEISVGQIITAVEGPIAITECLDDDHADCEIHSVCPCRTNWERINSAIRGALDGIALSEMAMPLALPLEPLSAAAPAAPETPETGENQ